MHQVQIDTVFGSVSVQKIPNNADFPEEFHERRLDWISQIRPNVANTIFVVPSFQVNFGNHWSPNIPNQPTGSLLIKSWLRMASFMKLTAHSARNNELTINCNQLKSICQPASHFYSPILLRIKHFKLNIPSKAIQCHTTTTTALCA